MDNWYEETIAEIKELMEQKKYDQAAGIVEKELSMPYIPCDVEKQLRALQKDIRFGVAENTRAMNSFKEILRKGPTVDMHFYLIIRTKGEIAPSTYAMFKHKICCLIDEGTSLKILDSGKGNKLPNKGKFGIYKRGNEEVKFKVIQHTFGRKLADKELKL